MTQDRPYAATVAAGTRFLVRLPANPSTGAVWRMGGDGGVVDQVSPPWFEVPIPRPGASGSMVFHLVATHTGRADLVFTVRAQGPTPSTPVTRLLHIDVPE